MLLFDREIEGKIRERLFRGRAILLFGPRQVGKTTLARKILTSEGNSDGYFNCELAGVRRNLVPGKPELLSELVGDKRLIVLDEAQTVPDIGRILKTFVDTYPAVQIIATGSSSFDLANKINEPLTGRAFEFTLFPLSSQEISTAYGAMTREMLYETLRFGSYPAIVAEPDRTIKRELLVTLATNYLFKDVFMLESIRNPRVFEDLLRLLALQIGSLVSFNELSQTLGVTRATVERYLRLLEQSFVIHVVRSFSNNPRTEMKRGFKVFFLDNGIRNAILDKIDPTIPDREDTGNLWENFIVSDRLRAQAYGDGGQVMFWRNRQQQEIDIVESSGGALHAMECKWKDQTIRIPAQFAKSYPQTTFDVMTPDRLLREIGQRKK